MFRTLVIIADVLLKGVLAIATFVLGAALVVAVLAGCVYIATLPFNYHFPFVWGLFYYALPIGIVVRIAEIANSKQ